MTSNPRPELANHIRYMDLPLLIRFPEVPGISDAYWQSVVKSFTTLCLYKHSTFNA